MCCICRLEVTSFPKNTGLHSRWFGIVRSSEVWGPKSSAQERISVNCETPRFNEFRRGRTRTPHGGGRRRPGNRYLEVTRNYECRSFEMFFVSIPSEFKAKSRSALTGGWYSFGTLRRMTAAVGGVAAVGGDWFVPAAAFGCLPAPRTTCRHAPALTRQSETKHRAFEAAVSTASAGPVRFGSQPFAASDTASKLN
jgi:hypothetical protein